MADALSRKALLLTTVRTKVLGFDLLKDLLLTYLFFGPIISDVAAEQRMISYYLRDSFSKETSFVFQRVA